VSALRTKGGCILIKVQDFTQRVGAYRKACRAANRSPDIKVLERIVTDLFTIEEQRELGSFARMVTAALTKPETAPNMTRTVQARGISLTNAAPIRVLVVDDQPVVRSGLAAFLSVYDNLTLVGEANDGAKAVNLCGQLRPDVVLMDLIMPHMDGAEATLAIRKHYPHIQVIALTSFKEDDLIKRVLEAGAIGYLLKNVSADELADAICAAHAGRPTLTLEATQLLIRQTRQNQFTQPGFDLTPREREVLVLMVEGLNNSAIAERLIISRSTVKFHVSNVLSKLQVSSRMAAITYAITHKLVPVG